MFRRGSVWWVSFVVNGKRYRTSTATSERKLAGDILHEIKARIAEGKWFDRLPGEDKTFKEMMDKYLEEHASKMASARDFAGYSKRLTSFFGDYLVAEVTPRLINAYKRKRREDGLKPASVNRELAAMKKAFNLAIKEWEWIRENPVMKVSMETENNERDRWLREDEETRLLSASPVWLRELTIFALNTGMRLSEILHLTWREVDLSRKTVTVISSKKSRKRTIPLNEKVSRLLLNKSTSRVSECEFVFPSNANTMFNKCNVSKAFRKTARKAKIQDFRFHDLRHTFATRLVQAGKDLYKVQRLLGHKSGNMTQRYSHHYPESLRDAVAALDENDGGHGGNNGSNGGVRSQFSHIQPKGASYPIANSLN